MTKLTADQDEIMRETTAPTVNQPGRWFVSEFGPPSVLKWEVLDPLPTPSSDDVLVSIFVSGVSGADNLQRVGGYPDPRCKRPGFTLGYDFVGEIKELGPTVPECLDLSVGDLVASLCTVGAYATHILLPASQLLKLQRVDDPVQMCALPLNYMTAYGLLKRSSVNLTRGSSILIGSASSGVGTAIAQLAEAFNMGLTMYGTCSVSKFDFVESLGVRPIDRRSLDITSQVRELTSGRGVDVAYDAVGSKESLQISHTSSKEGTGQVVCYGVISLIRAGGSGMLPYDFDPWKYIQDGNLPRGSVFAVTHDYYYTRKDLFLQDFQIVAEKVREGKLHPYICKLLPLGKAIEANELLASGEGVRGKMEFVVDLGLAKANAV